MNSWAQSRRERRRKRRRGEEIAGWVIVPIIALVLWMVGAPLYSQFKEPAMRALSEAGLVGHKGSGRHQEP